MENASDNESSHLSAHIGQDCNQSLSPLAFFRQAEMSDLGRHLICLCVQCNRKNVFNFLLFLFFYSIWFFIIFTVYSVILYLQLPHNINKNHIIVAI